MGFENLGHGLPGAREEDLARRGRGDDGPPVAPTGVDRPRHLHHAVGVGGSHDRTVVGVADGEGVGQRVVVGQVLAGVVGHREGTVGRPLVLGLGVHGDEAVHPTAVPRLVLGAPVVGEVEGAFGVGGPDGVEPERQQMPGEAAGRLRHGLGERTEPGGRVVVEAPDSRVGPEVVVERAVLHHEEDHVLDRSEIGTGRRLGGGPADRVRRSGRPGPSEQHPSGGGRGEPQERPPVETPHRHRPRPSYAAGSAVPGAVAPRRGWRPARR